MPHFFTYPLRIFALMLLLLTSILWIARAGHDGPRPQIIEAPDGRGQQERLYRIILGFNAPPQPLTPPFTFIQVDARASDAATIEFLGGQADAYAIPTVWRYRLYLTDNRLVRVEQARPRDGTLSYTQTTFHQWDAPISQKWHTGGLMGAGGGLFIFSRIIRQRRKIKWGGC